MPLPMVLATAVPRKNAARKLNAAAQATASFGDSTRVETTVAMLLAESWKPLRKSKINATRIVIRTRTTSLFMFQDFKVSRFKVQGLELTAKARKVQKLVHLAGQNSHDSALNVFASLKLWKLETWCYVLLTTMASITLAASS